MYFVNSQTWSLIARQEMSQLVETADRHASPSQRRITTINRIDGVATTLIFLGIPLSLIPMGLTGQWLYTVACLITIFVLLRVSAYMRTNPIKLVMDYTIRIRSSKVEVPAVLLSAIRKFYDDYRPSDYQFDRRNAKSRRPTPVDTASIDVADISTILAGWLEEFAGDFQDLLLSTSATAEQVEALNGAARAQFFEEFYMTVRPTLIRIAWLHSQKVNRYDMSTKQAELQNEMDEHEANRRAKFDQVILEKNLDVMNRAIDRITA